MKNASKKVWLLVAFSVCSGWIPSVFQENVLINSVSGNRIDSNWNEYQKDRQARLLSFNNDESNIRIYHPLLRFRDAFDINKECAEIKHLMRRCFEGQLIIELNFAVPFLHIPVGRESVEYGKAHPVIDINAKSLITASALLFMLLFIVPRLVRIFVPQASSRLSKGLEENEEIGKIVNMMDNMLDRMQIDRAACIQHAICTTVQTASKRVIERKASSWDKIIDGLASNILFQHFAYGSSAYDAAMYGLMMDKNCSSEYDHCNVNLQRIMSIAKMFI